AGGALCRWGAWSPRPRDARAVSRRACAVRRLSSRSPSSAWRRPARNPRRPRQRRDGLSPVIEPDRLLTQVRDEERVRLALVIGQARRDRLRSAQHDRGAVSGGPPPAAGVRPGPPSPPAPPPPHLNPPP